MEHKSAFEILLKSEKLLSEFSLTQIRELYTDLWLPVFSSIEKSIKVCSPCVIGVTGPPGVGKTSISFALKYLIEINKNEPVYTVSIDDFYFPPDVRVAKGVNWRALPGSHDVHQLRTLLEKMDQGQEIEFLPQYDMRNDCAREPLVVNSVINNLVLEGWFLDSNLKDYSFIANHINHLVYLDASIDDCKKWRFGREQKNRARGHEGYNENKMKRFWEEALEPGISKWVTLQKENADTIVFFDSNRKIKKVSHI